MFCDLAGIGFVLDGDALISACDSDRRALVPFGGSRTEIIERCILTDLF
jgi:hypothetical protein